MTAAKCDVKREMKELMKGCEGGNPRKTPRGTRLKTTLGLFVYFFPFLSKRDEEIVGFVFLLLFGLPLVCVFLVLSIRSFSVPLKETSPIGFH